MSEHNWTWAELNNEQMALIHEAEETLGADFLIALKEAEQQNASVDEPNTADLEVAELNESQLECLQGLEKMLNATIVAYQNTNA